MLLDFSYAYRYIYIYIEREREREKEREREREREREILSNGQRGNIISNKKIYKSYHLDKKHSLLNSVNT